MLPIPTLYSENLGKVTLFAAGPTITLPLLTGILYPTQYFMSNLSPLQKVQNLAETGDAVAVVLCELLDNLNYAQQENDLIAATTTSLIEVLSCELAKAAGSRSFDSMACEVVRRVAMWINNEPLGVYSSDRSTIVNALLDEVNDYECS